LLCNAFPLSNEAVSVFKTLKNGLCNASLGSQDGVLFEVKTDASDFALAAVLSQDSRLLRVCRKHSLRHSVVEKEATAVIEAVQKWLHFP